jgi:argonaute-like protein implicated in RNA metabolism and viral defense
MDAYELADEAKRQVELIYLVTDESIAKQLATMLDNYAKMLRQQADRIAELEGSSAKEDKRLKDLYASQLKFTTPQIKELSDEEIKDFIATFPIIFTPDDLLTFARAILKKAIKK